MAEAVHPPCSLLIADGDLCCLDISVPKLLAQLSHLILVPIL